MAGAVDEPALHNPTIAALYSVMLLQLLDATVAVPSWPFCVTRQSMKNRKAIPTAGPLATSYHMALDDEENGR